MRNRIILIAAMASGSLLLAGCAKLDNPAREQNSICFQAGCSLLRDDATKGSAPLSAGDQMLEFRVYGAKTVGGTRSNVFNGDLVENIYDQWKYSPVRFWDSNASSYEFLGVSGPQTILFENNTPLTAKVTYNPTVSQYDLMAACYHRNSNAQGTLDMSEPVALQFEHFLSAVSVTVYNDSPTQEITVLEYGFRNLYIESDVQFTYTSSTPQAQWLELSKKKNTTDLLLAHDPAGETATVWNMMIPQNLNPLSLAPLLMLKYRLGSDPSGEVIETPIRLSNMTTLSGNKITEWEPGKKYTYNIHIRYGGGITVHVVTTEWDEVKAGTPGLIVL
jgi:hypothetical protein